MIYILGLQLKLERIIKTIVELKQSVGHIWELVFLNGTSAAACSNQPPTPLRPTLTPLPTSSSDPLLVAAAQAAHEAKKRKIKTNIGPDGKIIPTIIKPRKKMDRFDGLPEDEVAKRILPDHLGPNLDIVIVSYDLAWYTPLPSTPPP